MLIRIGDYVVEFSKDLGVWTVKRIGGTEIIKTSEEKQDLIDWADGRMFVDDKQGGLF